jgi:hypothetical protein
LKNFGIYFLFTSEEMNCDFILDQRVFILEFLVHIL